MRTVKIPPVTDVWVITLLHILQPHKIILPLKLFCKDFKQHKLYGNLRGTVW